MYDDRTISIATCRVRGSSLEEAADTEYIVHRLVCAPVYTNENHESKTHMIGAQTGFSGVGHTFSRYNGYR